MEKNSIISLVKDGSIKLKDRSSSPKLDTELLLSFVIKETRSYLYAFPEKKINPKLVSSFWELINKRYKHYPIAYILGTKDFWSLSLMVSNHTLIPRPETEILVEKTLSLDLPNNAKIIDLGTGTGAIALAIAKEKPQWEIIGIDYSSVIIELAEKNKQLNKIDNANFFVSNWFSEIQDHKFNLVVSNPPYIDKNDLHLKKGDIQFEPFSALISNNNGLKDIHLICNQAQDFLHQNSWLLLEHGYSQGDLVRSIMRKIGYINVNTQKDHNQLDRMTFGQWPN